MEKERDGAGFPKWHDLGEMELFWQHCVYTVDIDRKGQGRDYGQKEI